MKHKVERSEAVGQAKSVLAGEDIDDPFAKLEKEEQIERMLSEIKEQHLFLGNPEKVSTSPRCRS